MAQINKDDHSTLEPRVLVIDDDRFFIRPALMDLTDHGFQVTSVTTVREALELINGDQTFDAIFTDIMMPSSPDFEAMYGTTNNGLETGTRLAEVIREAHPDIQIVAYTAARRSNLGFDADNSPFDHIVSKSSVADDMLIWSELQENYLARLLEKPKKWVKDSLSHEELVLYQAKPELFKSQLEEFQSRRSQIIVSVNEDLLRVLNGNVENIPELSPREFEEICALALSRLGYDVTITPPGPDDGIDLIAVDESALFRSALLVQCKRHRLDLKVETPTLKQLKCVVDDYRASGGIVMTSSYFTSGAERYARENQYKITLFDVLRLKALLEEGSEKV